ncbi:MAG TPA: nicotinate-nucleotide adenylyltransferase [Gammaproteobacteria bacterium]|nr:nicotinate-nucleotide adenylyltransferase [Gammaproteobacteria bacterium]
MIGILGGTFDPIHFGHLRPALELLQELGLDHVRLLPAHVPPHRDAPHATPAQRRRMVELAVRDQPGLCLDDRELRREGPSYMVDTLQALRGEMGARPLCLMLGMDAFLGLPGWHRWEELAELAHLIVMRRPGWDAPTEGPLAALVGSRQAEQPADLARSPAGRLLFCTVTQLEIAATYIRQQLAQGMNPRYLLPDRVLGYLRDEHIYD